MSDAMKKLISDELRGVDELLNIHSYHKQVLTDLLRKMDAETGKLGRHINTLPITQRSINCLMAEGVYTVEELTRLTHIGLMKLPNLGKKSLLEIEDALAKEGLSLNSDRIVEPRLETPKQECLPDVDWLKPVEVVNKAINKTDESNPDLDFVISRQIEPRKHGPRISEERVIQVAKIVASRIRKSGGLKYRHIRDMAKTGEISDYEMTRLPYRIQPRKMGAELYKFIFEGTKYANKI